MVARYLSLVRFSHTVFALPFALTGLTLGFRDRWKAGFSLDFQHDYPKLLFVLLCMVTARNAAMAFNRWADRRFDALNPRTAVRDIPAGRVSARHALVFTIFNCLAFMGSAWLINPLCFALSPVALAVVLGYSYTKRFTPLCHLILGLGLGLAPVGAYVAVTESFSLAPIELGIAVVCWVSGFDIIYALQDEGFDRQHRLHSVPAWLGGRRALWTSFCLHVVSALFIVEFASNAGAGPLMVVAVLVFIGLLGWQHSLVRPDDLSRVNAAFFTANGIASVVFGLLAITDLILVAAGYYARLF